jgi:hypothetical protein
LWGTQRSSGCQKAQHFNFDVDKRQSERVYFIPFKDGVVDLPAQAKHATAAVAIAVCGCF